MIIDIYIPSFRRRGLRGGLKNLSKIIIAKNNHSLPLLNKEGIIGSLKIK
jgi:hypothetical protein